MIPYNELANMKTEPYAEEAVDLYLAYLNAMMNVIQAAKYGDDCYIVHGEEYYEEETPESTYVLDSLRELGYYIEKKSMFNIDGEVQYSTVISWS
jgi:hypothetical protein